MGLFAKFRRQADDDEDEDEAATETETETAAAADEQAPAPAGPAPAPAGDGDGDGEGGIRVPAALEPRLRETYVAVAENEGENMKTIAGHVTRVTLRTAYRYLQLLAQQGYVRLDEGDPSVRGKAVHLR
jgi:hypothetical protein